ncbi:integrase core domain-containing protein [Gammaproteobacteria bacterium]|jgi:putative transposase|nr:integrase core domain-containing protein [Gammaproteobacteria bacterium]MDC3362507.1 integrase core domain-containing protein [Gammaproteobacteria bacterium]
MRWAKLLSNLSQNVNEELLKQNELLEAQVLELQQHQQGQIRDTEFFKRHMARLTKGLSNTALEAACLVVKPSTVLRWHRELIAKKFDGSKNRSYPGRPRIGSAMESLIVALAEDNCWGALRIQGALKHIGHTVSHQTVLNVLKRHGLHPSPYRIADNSWAKFLKFHLAVTVATDFLTQEVITAKGYVTYYILFFIRLDTRRVHVAGITQYPNQNWMLQVARNLAGVNEDFLDRSRYLICDRDTKYTRQFKWLFREHGIKTIRLPPYSPNLNAYAERWARSIKEDCLNHLVLLGEGSLRHAVSEYVEFYNHERPHQGLDNELVVPELGEIKAEGEVKIKSRLGGLLNFYYR